MRRVAGVPRTTRTASFTVVFYLIIIVSRARDFVNNGDAHRREANADARNGKSPSFDELFRRGGRHSGNLPLKHAVQYPKFLFSPVSGRHSSGRKPMLSQPSSRHISSSVLSPTAKRFLSLGICMP